MPLAYVTARQADGSPLCCPDCASAPQASGIAGIADLTIFRGSSGGGQPVSGGVVNPFETISVVPACSGCDNGVDWTLTDASGSVINSATIRCNMPLNSGVGPWSFQAPGVEGTYKITARYNKDWACLGIGGGGTDILTFTVKAGTPTPKPPPVGDCGFLGLSCIANETKTLLKWTGFAALGVTAVIVIPKVVGLFPRKG